MHTPLSHTSVLVHTFAEALCSAWKIAPPSSRYCWQTSLPLRPPPKGFPTTTILTPGLG